MDTEKVKKKKSKKNNNLIANQQNLKWWVEGLVVQLSNRIFMYNAQGIVFDPCDWKWKNSMD